MGTYKLRIPTNAHKYMNSLCKRYVVTTYRTILFNSCKKHVFDTCNSGELILIGTEKIRSNGYSVFYCTFILLLGAILYK